MLPKWQMKRLKSIHNGCPSVRPVGGLVIVTLEIFSPVLSSAMVPPRGGKMGSG